MAPLAEDSGVGLNADLPYVNSIVIAAFLAVGFYNVIELTIIMGTFFKRYAGVYFYALLVSNLGIFLHALTNVFKFWKVTDELPGHAVANTIVAWTAWVMMITGQSVVLWSRLHLVAPVWWTRWILVVIIVDAIVLHTSTGVLTFLTNLSSDPKPYKGPYGVVEKLQVTLFFIQELILSGIYIWRTAAMLRSEDPLFKTSQTMRGSKGRKVLIHTIAMSAIIIALDIALVTIEFLRLYDIQTSFKDAVYSVKLKMEFSILNALIKLVKGKLGDGRTTEPDWKSGNSSGRNDTARFSSAFKSSRRQSNVLSAGALRHPAITYSPTDGRLRESEEIQSQRLKSGSVLKTMTTEVSVDKVEKGRDDAGSATSSTVYIIEHNNSGI